MLKNYFKTAWRNLSGNKLYSFINIAGLAIGLSVCMMIMLYVGHEYSYDRFHKRASSIFIVQAKMKMGSDSMTLPWLSYGAGPIIKNAEPAVQGFLRTRKPDKYPVIQNPHSPSEKYTEKYFLFADDNFFQLFSFPLLTGNKISALQSPFSVVISEKAARKYFGTNNPIGKILRYNNTYNLTVTGVAEKIPSNSSIRFDFIASLSSLSGIDEEKPQVNGSQRVQAGSFSTYFLLKGYGDAHRLEASFNKWAASGGEDGTRYIATPLTASHFMVNMGQVANNRYLVFFPWIAGRVLLLALTNYISLSTAKSSSRAKEIGVRKAMGAGRITIAAQFFTESAIYTALSFALACGICIALQPFLFHFLGTEADARFLFYPPVVLSFAGLFLATIILSGIYPSILLSAYKPVLVLYGKVFHRSGGLSLRKFITVFQFTISIALIICVVVIQRQMNFFRHADTGIDRENIVMIPFESMKGKHYSAMKREVSLLSGVKGVTTSRYQMYRGTDIFFTTEKGTSAEVTLPVMNVDANFIPLLGIQWKIHPMDSFYVQKRNIVAINEAAITKLNLSPNPVGESFDFAGNKIQITGVIRDFNYSSFRSKIDAVCLFINQDTAPMWNEMGGQLFAKIQRQANIPLVIDQIRSVYAKYERQKPFEYTFMEETFEDMYMAENRLSRISTVFTIFILFIACMGLFGLATSSAERRTKEIGVRKVLGASVESIVTLLSKDFLKLIFVALVISSPIAWWAMHKWLEEFAYRVEISWWIFLVVSVIVFAVAILSVGFQAMKAALQNPVRSLRAE